MRARVQKWGNSLAVRIPKSLALESQLGQNTLIEMSLEAGKIVLVHIAPAELTLDQLLEGVTPNDLHRETETGEAVGHEVW